MNSLRSAVASVLRLAGVGLLLLGVVFCALAFAAGRQDDGGTWFWVLGGGAFFGGVLVLVFSSALARVLTRDHE